MKPVADWYTSSVFLSNKKLSGRFSETTQTLSTSIEDTPASPDCHVISTKRKRRRKGIPLGVKNSFSTSIFFNRQLQIVPFNPLAKMLPQQPLIFQNIPSLPSLPIESLEELIDTDESDTDVNTSDVQIVPVPIMLSQQPLETLEDIFTDTEVDVSDVETIPTSTMLSLEHSDTIQDMSLTTVSDSDMCLNGDKIIEVSVSSQSQLSDNVPSLPSLPIESLEELINTDESDTDVNTCDVQIVPVPIMLSQQPLETLEDIFTDTEVDVSDVETIPTSTMLSLEHSDTIQDMSLTTVSDSDMCLNGDKIIEVSVSSQSQLSDNIPSLPSLPIGSLEELINTDESDTDVNSCDVQIVPVPIMLSQQPLETLEDIFTDTEVDVSDVETIPTSTMLSLEHSDTIQDMSLTTVSDSDMCLNGDKIIEVSVSSQSQLSDNIPSLPSLPIESLEELINTDESDTDVNSCDVQIVPVPIMLSQQPLETLEDIFIDTEVDVSDVETIPTSTMEM